MEKQTENQIIKGKLISNSTKLKSIKLVNNETIIGRGPKFGIENPAVSTKHFTITYKHIGDIETCILKDISRNGTWLNGEKLSNNEEKNLFMFDEIQIVKTPN